MGLCIKSFCCGMGLCIKSFCCGMGLFCWSDICCKCCGCNSPYADTAFRPCLRSLGNIPDKERVRWVLASTGGRYSLARMATRCGSLCWRRRRRRCTATMGRSTAGRWRGAFACCRAPSWCASLSWGRSNSHKTYKNSCIFELTRNFDKHKSIMTCSIVLKGHHPSELNGLEFAHAYTMSESDFTSIFDYIVVGVRPVGFNEVCYEPHEGKACGACRGLCCGCLDYWCCCAGMKALCCYKKADADLQEYHEPCCSCCA